MPVFGLTPEQLAAHLNPVAPISAYRNNPAAIAAGLSLEARDEAYAATLAAKTTSGIATPAQRPDATLPAERALDPKPTLAGLPAGKAIDDLVRPAAALPRIPTAVAQKPDATLGPARVSAPVVPLAQPKTIVKPSDPLPKLPTVQETRKTAGGYLE